MNQSSVLDNPFHNQLQQDHEEYRMLDDDEDFKPKATWMEKYGIVISFLAFLILIALVHSLVPRSEQKLAFTVVIGCLAYAVQETRIRDLEAKVRKLEGETW